MSLAETQPRPYIRRFYPQEILLDGNFEAQEWARCECARRVCPFFFVFFLLIVGSGMIHRQRAQRAG